MTAQAVITKASSYHGVVQGSQQHRHMIDQYNRIQPIPVGYRVKYTDDWCDAFVTFIGDSTGANVLFGRECGVQRHVNIFKKKGIWLGRVIPEKGDIVVFDWDGQGFADHIGFVESVNYPKITTIEGNSNNQVARRYYQWNHHQIMGYARPKYHKETTNAKTNSQEKSLQEVANEVIKGLWGNGAERINRLTQAGYPADKVQKLVNQKVQIRKDCRLLEQATHWVTGEQIPTWLKGQTLQVVNEKINKDNSKCYLLSRKDVVIGWINENDIALSENLSV